MSTRHELLPRPLHTGKFSARGSYYQAKKSCRRCAVRWTVPDALRGSGSDRVKHVCVAGWLAGEESLPPGPAIGDGSRPRRAYLACHAAGVWGRQDVEFEFGLGLFFELMEHRAQLVGVVVTAARLLSVTAQHIAAGVYLLGRDILVEVR